MLNMTGHSKARSIDRLVAAMVNVIGPAEDFFEHCVHFRLREIIQTLPQ